MSPRPWLTGWTLDDPPKLGYSYLPRDEWPDTGGIRTHLTFRDSRLTEATDGLIGAQYVGYCGDGSEDEDHGWHFHDLDWQCFLLLAGTMTQETEEFGPTHLSAGDTAYYPGIYWHREYDFSPDWEMVALRVPAKTKTTTGRDQPLPERAAGMDPNRRAVYSFERPGAYVAGTGPEQQFAYRDLGSAIPSEGRLAMRIVKAAAPGASSPRHHHSSSSWFVVMSGSALIRVGEEPEVELGYRDAMSIGPGPGMAHTIRSASEDFKIFELTIPAEYETVEE
ncbi:MAG TPA: cupin domain-containing protein [Gaiellaceae bacterium]|nr:cupin domain-containing protein [Gaiellaceae bacterium]